MQIDVEIGSVMKYIYDAHPCQIYLRGVPADFEIPSVYLPTPFHFDAPDTLRTFLTAYQIPIKVFGADTWAAYNHATEIADAIRTNRHLVPILDEAAAPTGGYIRIKRCDVRGVDGAEGVALLTLQWDSRYEYNRPTYPKMGKFFLKQFVKEPIVV